MKLWKGFYSRIFAFTFCFMLGSLLAILFIKTPDRLKTVIKEPVKLENTSFRKAYPSPEHIVSLITHPEPIIRRGIYQELFLRPKKDNIYYDYQRDIEYPERADNVKLEYVKLDKISETAVIKFVHLGNPSAIILQKQINGWVVIDCLSSWEKSFDNNLDSWLQTVSLIEPNIYEILVREVITDASSYHSQLSIFKLINNQLKKVGELPELVVKQHPNNKEDWADIKNLTVTTYQKPNSSNPNFLLNIKQEIIHYIGEVPEYIYWSDIDNSWHTAKQHWHNRAYKVLEVIDQKEVVLRWNSEKQYFVKK